MDYQHLEENLQILISNHPSVAEVLKLIMDDPNNSMSTYQEAVEQLVPGYKLLKLQLNPTN